MSNKENLEREANHSGLTMKQDYGYISTIAQAQE